MHQPQQMQQHPAHRWLSITPCFTPIKCNCYKTQCRGKQRRKVQLKRKIITAASFMPFAAVTVSQQAATAAPATAAVVAAVTAPHVPAILSSAGVLILCCAAAAVLLAGIPLLWSLTRTANRMESMLQTLEMELPDTAAAIRLSSLELSDCVSELGALGNDVSSGLQSAARMVTATEAGVKQGVQVLSTTVVPALAQRETRIRDVMEAALKARAELAPQIPRVRAAVAATTVTARRLRGALALSRAFVGVYDIGRALRLQLDLVAARQLMQQHQQREARAAGSPDAAAADANTDGRQHT